MTKVIIDGVEYAPVQQAVQKKAIQWRAERGGRYWCVSDTGEITITYENMPSVDDYHYLTGNYYQTKEQAEKALAYSQALGRVTHAILNANDGWEADWGDFDQHKYYITYWYTAKKFMVDNNTYVQHMRKLPHIKSKEIAEQIIKDHKEDLNIIFGV